jgi:hypothetical protein
LIPWMVAGPSVRRNFDLTLVEGLAIDTMATFATACDYLGIRVPYPIDGHPVSAIFSEPSPLVGPR